MPGAANGTSAIMGAGRGYSAREYQVFEGRAPWHLACARHVSGAQIRPAQSDLRDVGGRHPDLRQDGAIRRILPRAPAVPQAHPDIPRSVCDDPYGIAVRGINPGEDPGFNDCALWPDLAGMNDAAKRIDVIECLSVRAEARTVGDADRRKVDFGYALAVPAIDATGLFRFCIVHRCKPDRPSSATVASFSRLPGASGSSCEIRSERPLAGSKRARPVFMPASKMPSPAGSTQPIGAGASYDRTAPEAGSKRCTRCCLISTNQRCSVEGSHAGPSPSVISPAQTRSILLMVISSVC
jgi:hypothetical protein